MTFRGSRYLLIISGVVALAALVAAGSMIGSPSPPWPGVVVAVAGVNPGLICGMIAVRARAGGSASLSARRFAFVVAGAVIVAGVILVIVAGVVAMRDDHFLFDLQHATAGWRSLVRSASATAPISLALLGVGCIVAAAATVSRNRRLLVVAGLIGTAVTGFVAVTTAGGGIYRIRQGLPRTIDASAVATAGVLVVAAALVLVAVGFTARSWPGASADQRASHGRRAQVTVTTVVGVGVVGALGIWGWFTWGPRHTVEDVFVDPHLAACVASALGHDDATAHVSDNDLDDLRSLDCNGNRSDRDTAARHPTNEDGIADLTGVERLTNLTTLDLTNNRVQDLEPLGDLNKLGTLTLTHNEVADLTPLADHPRLSDLGLSGNAITSLGPLAEVPNLRHLGLADNRIDDIAPLAGATGVAELNIGRNDIRDLTALAGMDELRRLTISGNSVADPSPLGTLPHLTMLDAARNNITDAELFVGFPTLDELWLGENPLDDVRPLADLPSLLGVDLVGLDSSTPGIDLLRDNGIYVGMT